MKTMILKRVARALAVMACITVMLSEVVSVNAAGKAAESMQSNCSCSKMLIYARWGRSDCISNAYHRSWYFRQYECQHGITSLEESEIEYHNMFRKDEGHAPGTIQHQYLETCSRCDFKRRVKDLCYCER